MSAESPTHGKLKPGGNEPICTLTASECDPAIGCLVLIPKDKKDLREKLGIDSAFSSIQHYAFVAATPAFKESTTDISVVIARGYTNTGDKKFTIKPSHRKVVAPELGSTRDATWLLVSCHEGLKGSRMRKFLKGVQIFDEEDPSLICKNNSELVAVGTNEGKLVYQPFKIVTTDEDTFVVGRDVFRDLKPSGPILDKDKKNVLGYYWSREHKMVVSWIARGKSPATQLL